VRALYRGFTPSLVGMIPYAGTSFYCFESSKHALIKHLPRLACQRDKHGQLTTTLHVPFMLICGGLSGAAAQTFAYPLDVSRRRMQLAMMSPETERYARGMFFTLKMIYKENGVIRGLYRGLSINYLRAVPMVALSFTTNELMKDFLKVSKKS